MSAPLHVAEIPRRDGNAALACLHARWRRRGPARWRRLSGPVRWSRRHLGASNRAPPSAWAHRPRLNATLAAEMALAFARWRKRNSRVCMFVFVRCLPVRMSVCLRTTSPLRLLAGASTACYLLSTLCYVLLTTYCLLRITTYYYFCTQNLHQRRCSESALKTYVVRICNRGKRVPNLHLRRTCSKSARWHKPQNLHTRRTCSESAAKTYVPRICTQELRAQNLHPRRTCSESASKAHFQEICTQDVRALNLPAGACLRICTQDVRAQSLRPRRISQKSVPKT